MSAATLAPSPAGLARVLGERGMTLADAAKITGIREEDLGKLACGDAESIRFTTLTALCTGLGCTPADLLPAPHTPDLDPQGGSRWWVRAWAYRSPSWAWASMILSAITATAFLLVIVSTVDPVDFLVYRYSATDAWAGKSFYELNTVGPMLGDEGLPFTYTPVAALVLLVTTPGSPLAAFLGWSAATTALTIIVFYRLLPGTWRDRPLPLGLITIWGVCNIVTASHLIFGQINVFLMTLILLDLTRHTSTGTDPTRPSPGGTRRSGWVLPIGVLTGIAAAIKLTPALFIVYLWVSGQYRAARTSTLTAGIATLIGVLAFPPASWTFFTTTLWNLSDRVSLDGFFATSGNQSIHGALAAIGPWTNHLALGLSIIAVLAGLGCAAKAHHAGETWEPVLIIGLTACLVSPVSWMHHWVYLPVALLLLAQHRHHTIRYTAWAGSLILLATGPTLGDILLSWNQPALLPLALILRESILLLSLISIIALTTNPHHTTENTTSRAH